MVLTPCIAEELRGRGLTRTRDQGLCQRGQDDTHFNIVRLLKACTATKDLHKGSELHAYVHKHNCLGRNTYIGNTLVSMYSKCGALDKAYQVLRELPVRDVVSWNALITGYAQQGQGEEALKCFDDMLDEGHFPNAVTFICVLKACGSVRAAAKGEQIHDQIASLGLLKKDIVLGNTLVDMYAKCGLLSMAHQVFKELPVHDVVSWNALIAGYAQQGQGEEALKCFDVMVHEGHSPSAITFVCVLKACGSMGAVAKGEETHEKIVAMDMLDKDIVLGNTLIDMYAKCGALAKAHRVLKELPRPDVVSWNALIGAYAQQGQGEEALKCFDVMISEQHTPTAVTFICALKACGSIGAAAKGKEIHDKIVSLGMLEKNVVLGTTLVDTYVKCGALAKAQQVLEELPVRDAVSWSALIAGYAQEGQSVEAIKCFEQMQSNGLKPDLITMTIVLNACSHSGLVDQAEAYFSGMSTMYEIHPNLELHCCMIDIFARAGKFNKALSLIAMTANDKCLSSWVAVLGACRKWAEVNIGTLAFEHAHNLGKCNAAVYVLMADIYTAAGMQEDVHAVEVMRMANKA